MTSLVCTVAHCEMRNVEDQRTGADPAFREEGCIENNETQSVAAAGSKCVRPHVPKTICLASMRAKNRGTSSHYGSFS